MNILDYVLEATRDPSLHPSDVVVANVLVNVNSGLVAAADVVS